MKFSNVQAAAAQQGFRRQRVPVKNQDYTVHAEGINVGYRYFNTVTVTNTGKVAGKEAVQLYVSAPAGGLEKPAQELKAFAKTRTLAPGESQVLTFKVSTYELASYNEATQAWETAAGKYTLRFSANVEDTRATATYSLAKPQSVAGHDVMKLQ